ncbi:MAG: TraB/GumN family protein [Bacteroidales bacterium]|jgi:uncharacterized protein YbaP (TraB family)|nr:TraB/GumN family protein [Bacteroidales bacterium]
MKHLTFILPLFCAFQLNAQSLLWEISGNGLTEKSYLFGSIHIQDKRVFELDSLAWNGFNESKYFALEFDIENIDPMAMAKRMIMQQSYEELLSKEDFKLLKKVAKKYVDAPFMGLKRMKPFFVAAAISQSVLPKDEKDPLDLFLLKKARKANKTILELESFDLQMDVIDSFSFEEQLQTLIELIHTPNLEDSLKKESEELIQAYLNQSDKKLYKLLMESDDNEEFMKKFINERNHNMAKKILTFLPNGGTFIVVGAGHLAGDEGLVNLLKTNGYTLTPLCSCF